MGGQTQQGSSLFGNQAKPTSLFGASTPALNPTTSFGANAFGQNNQQQQPNSLFGQTAPAVSMFGQQQQQQQQQPQNLFGQTSPTPFGTQNTSLFQPQQQQGTFLPQTATQQTSLFGQQQQPTSLFGQQQQQQQQPSSLFGVNPAPTLGQNTSLFGNLQQPAQNPSLFGQAGAPSLFGGQQQQPNSLFSAQTVNQPQQQQGSVFSQPVNSAMPTFSGLATPLFQQPTPLVSPMDLNTQAILPQLLLQAAL